MKIKFKIINFELDQASFIKFIASLGEINETLIFNGRYSLIREFGLSATTLDENTIAEFTKDYMDSGLSHNEAYGMATAFAEDIAINGFSSMPFLRTAIDNTILKYKDIPLDFSELDNVINEILLEAISNYEKDSLKVKFSLPMDVDVIKE